MSYLGELNEGREGIQGVKPLPPDTDPRELFESGIIELKMAQETL